MRFWPKRKAVIPDVDEEIVALETLATEPESATSNDAVVDWIVEAQEEAPEPEPIPEPEPEPEPEVPPEPPHLLAVIDRINPRWRHGERDGVVCDWHVFMSDQPGNTLQAGKLLVTSEIPAEQREGHVREQMGLLVESVARERAEIGDTLSLEGAMFGEADNGDA